MRLESHLLKSGYKKGLLFGLSLVIVFLNPIDTMENTHDSDKLEPITDSNKVEIYSEIQETLVLIRNTYGFPENPAPDAENEQIEKHVSTYVKRVYEQALDGNKIAQNLFGALRFHFHKLEKPDRFCTHFTTARNLKQFAESNPLIRNRHPIDLITHPSSSLIH